MKKQPKLLCPKCGSTLKYIPDSNSGNYGYCNRCQAWQQGKVAEDHVAQQQ